MPRLAESSTGRAAADILDAAESAGWTFRYAVVLGDGDTWHVVRPPRRAPGVPNYRPLISRHWGEICRLLHDRRAATLLVPYTPSERQRLEWVRLRWAVLQDELDACMVADWVRDQLAGETTSDFDGVPF